MFTVYTKPNCKYCVKAKDLLNMKGEPFLEIDISENVDAKQRLKSRGFKTVPQIYLDTEEQELIGGYEDLEKFMLQMINWRRTKTMFGTGAMEVDPTKTIHIRQGKDGSTTVTKEDRAKEYKISITEKQEMKDITPKNDT